MSSIPDFVFVKWVCCRLFLNIIMISSIHEKMVMCVIDDVIKCPMPGYCGTSIPDFAPQKVVCSCIFLTFGIVPPICANLTRVTDDVIKCPGEGVSGTPGANLPRVQYSIPAFF